MGKEMLGAKVAPRTFDRLEEYADKEGISKSEAADRMIKQGLDVEESNMRLVPLRSDGGTVIEDQLEELEASQASSLEDTQSQVNRLSEEVEELDQSLEKRSKDRFLLNSVLVVSVIWLATAITIGFGTVATIVSGLALVGSLVYLYFQ